MPVTQPVAALSVPAPDEAIVYQFSGSRVERDDYRHFPAIYEPDQLPSGCRLDKAARS